MENKRKMAIWVIVVMIFCTYMIACEDTLLNREDETTDESQEHPQGTGTHLETILNEAEVENQRKNELKTYAQRIIDEVIREDERIRKGLEPNKNLENRFRNKVLISKVYITEINLIRTFIFGNSPEIEDMNINFFIFFKEEQLTLVSDNFSARKSYIIKMRVVDFEVTMAPIQLTLLCELIPE